jgi:hypothetical protein
MKSVTTKSLHTYKPGLATTKVRLGIVVTERQP